MKAIITGKLYDTDTATLLGETNYSQPGDFFAWSEKLYRTKNGTYFLWGIGSCQSKYRVQVARNEWSGSSKLILMTVDKAKEWAEEYMPAEDYINIFGAVAEG